MSVIELIRHDLKKFTPYHATKRIASTDETLLNANESPFANVHYLDLPLNRYPEKQPQQLLERIAKLNQISSEQIVLGRGSDELIDLLIRLFCRAEHDAVMVCPPAFVMYSVSAQLQNAQVIEVPLKKADYSLDLPAISAAWCEQVKIIFLCSPNNPTGNMMNENDIFSLCEQYKNKSVIVVDEAYIEFAKQKSVIDAIKQYDNLIVLRTFSKAYGLAGIRCGMLFAQASLVPWLLSILAPYPLPVYVADIVLQALSPNALATMQEQIVSIQSERDRLQAALQQLPIVKKVWSSEANFLLVDFHDAKNVITACKAANIIIRDYKTPKALADSLRISIGLPNENAKLLQVLQQLGETCKRK